jgi:hypothetical protein
VLPEPFEQDGWSIEFINDDERYRRGETHEMIRETYLLQCVKYIKGFNLHVLETMKVTRVLYDTEREKAKVEIREFLTRQEKRAIEMRIRTEERL